MAPRRNTAAQPISACLESVDTAAGRERVVDYLKSIPYPHYEQAPDAPGFLLRIDADGTRSVGKFVNREFMPRVMT